MDPRMSTSNPTLPQRHTSSTTTPSPNMSASASTSPPAQAPAPAASRHHRPLTRAAVEEAHALIKPHIHATPVLTNTTLSQLASTPQTTAALQGTPWQGKKAATPKMRLFFKCENFQRIGAFKVRGAFHAVLRLIEAQGLDEVRRTGVVTHSSGASLPCVHGCHCCRRRLYRHENPMEAQALTAPLRASRKPRAGPRPRRAHFCCPGAHRHAYHQHTLQDRRHPRPGR